MAHQTFYIDIDEEITSIVDRLRKAKAREIIVVVPKRALLIQSIVNLKLLKKEAENLGKQMIIVTQDKLGKMLVEKAGIAVEQRLDDIDGEEVAVVENSIPYDANPLNSAKDGEKMRERLQNIGSPEYFHENPLKKAIASELKAEQRAEENEAYETEKITNKELVAGVPSTVGEKKSFFGKTSAMDIIKNMKISQSGAGKEEKNTSENKDTLLLPESSSESFLPARRGFGGNTSSAGADRLKDFYQNGENSRRIKQERYDYKNVNLSNHFWKYFLIFGAAALLLVALAAAYLFLPKVDIKILAKAKVQSLDMQIKGDSAVQALDLDSLAIPAKTVSQNVEVAKNFNASGDKSASNQKTHGIITIYNEYSNATQPLVATTRFLSENGKLFRLVKTVIVPGTSTVGGEVKPGAVEAEVIADESGEAYNIEPAKFTIPGFQGSGNDKYTKFYAKSSKAMTGGKSGPGSVKTVTENDIANAKNSIADDIRAKAREQIKNEFGENSVVLDDALNIENITYSSSANSGEIAENFTLTTKAKASAVIFNQSDVLKLAAGQINKNKDKNAALVSEDAVVLEFGKTDVDFAKGTVLIRVHVTGKTTDMLDVSNLKKGILGKSEDDFKAYLKQYNQITGAEIEYWPPFISGKIPAYESRVTITLDSGN
ncbi:MAG: hypothetical protein WC608_00825 [Parcubacteria group bacterium]